MTGLQHLLDNIAGKTLLDVGAAEGLISIECLKRGARAVYGVEIVPEFVEEATKASRGMNAIFIKADANTWAPGPDERYDVVLMLAVLQKLKEPSAACKRIARCARDLVVIRLPPGNAPVIIDQRSGMRPHDIEHAMREAGFYLVARCDGPVAEAGAPEQTLYFARADRD